MIVGQISFNQRLISKDSQFHNKSVDILGSHDPHIYILCFFFNLILIIIFVAIELATTESFATHDKVGRAKAST